MCIRDSHSLLLGNRGREQELQLIVAHSHAGRVGFDLFGHFAVFFPVSYTHLDVYKRQQFAQVDLIEIAVGLIPYGEAGGDLLIDQPVSYTHLDVYKRQPMYLSLLRT